MRVLSGLQPAAVFHYFEELCAIPHGSGNTKAISDYCVAFAKERGLSVRQDGENNVIIKKPAYPGYEDAPTVILQGHLDMVAEKTEDCPLDLEKDGLVLRVDGDWICATDTTLGGDDGIAVAIALAILADNTIPHPALEVLLTTDEETGMYGAKGLDASDIHGRKLLNLDSENEGVFTVGCAGGVSVECRYDMPVVPADTGITLTVDGLVGGHSGIAIHEGRANACKVLGTVLEQILASVPCTIAALRGGSKGNAIANAACAVLAAEEKDFAEIVRIAADVEAQLRKEYAATDPGLHITAEPAKQVSSAVSREDSLRLVQHLTRCPNGVVAMSRDIPGLVQTSLNFGILRMENGKCMALHTIRSSVEAEKAELLHRVEELAVSLGGTTEAGEGYPAWEYRQDSPVRELAVATYREMYGKDPVVEVIHAGLECGLLAEKMPGLDSVSYGPDMQDIHTVKERLSISSTERIWNFTLEVLRRSK